MIAFTATATAHEVITTKLTWSREVSRIFYRRCIQCHRTEGGVFALTSYQEARPWAQAIKEEVLARRMPPWFAVKGFGEFQHDAGLTQEEIEIISDWVEGGAPKGEDKLLPQIPEPAKQPAAPPAGGSIEVNGALTLKRAAKLTGVRPVTLNEGASVRLIAELPDGSLAPLIWLHNYNPRFPRTYYFKTAVALPAGARIRMNPPGGAVALITSTR